MASYGKKASDKVEEEMHEFKRGTLKSGSGKKVTSRKQAIAIGLSEARREGGKVPAKKSSSAGAKKTPLIFRSMNWLQISSACLRLASSSSSGLVEPPQSRP